MKRHTNKFFCKTENTLNIMSRITLKHPWNKHVTVGRQTSFHREITFREWLGSLGFCFCLVNKIPSSGCPVSSISYIYYDAIASVVPSLRRQVMWYWQGINGSCAVALWLNWPQIVTNPSKPPIVNIPQMLKEMTLTESVCFTLLTFSLWHLKICFFWISEFSSRYPLAIQPSTELNT